MNIYDFSNYVNQDVDDTFSVEEIARFFNKAVANFNLIPPVTKYPFITMDAEVLPGQVDTVNEFVGAQLDSTYKTDVVKNTFENNTFSTNADYDDQIGAYTDYPFSKTFMLAVMLPYVVSAVKGQESSLTEKQLAMQEFMRNGMQYKSITNISEFLLNQQNTDINEYQLGENVYLSDMRYAPFANEWGKAIAYKEIKDKEEE